MRKRSRSEYHYLKGILNRFNPHSYKIINENEEIYDESKPLKNPAIIIELFLYFNNSMDTGINTFMIIKLKKKELQVVCADNILLDGRTIKDYYYYQLEELKEFLLIINEKENLV